LTSFMPFRVPQAYLNSCGNGPAPSAIFAHSRSLDGGSSGFRHRAARL
jgi:hypothetical protein